MGIYVKKKNRVLKFTIYSLFVIFLIIIFLYYFFISKNEINFSIIDENQQKKIEAENLNLSEETLIQNSNIIDLEDYVKVDQLNSAVSKIIKEEDLDLIVENFIKNNPDFILEVLRNYQNEQNQIEQEKINIKNLSKINKIYSDEHSMFVGSKDTKKRIFEFVDYNCGYCLKFHEEVERVMRNDPSIQLVIIQMPILGNMSNELSKIAIASSLQGKFKEVHNYLYSLNRKSNIEDILADLFLLNLDLSKLEADLNSDEIKNISLKHKNYVNEFKFSGTPAIIIGNSIIPGFIEADKIIEILKKEFF
tara:strand:+ start:405 stop:1322 length:918 start_codon:yes stop_codon:yes gene_type:complete